MGHYTPFWLGLGFAGFVLGLFVRPMVLLRMAIALALLAGLGLMIANVMDASTWAFRFGAMGVGLIVIFGVALVGAFAGRLVRQAVHEEPPMRRRELNSILQD